MTAGLNALVAALYVKIDDHLGTPHRTGRRAIAWALDQSIRRRGAHGQVDLQERRAPWM